MRIDRDDVAAALDGRVGELLEHLGVTHRRLGREIKTPHCPKCGQRNRRDAVSVSAVTGQWFCHAHQCKGTIFDAVMAWQSCDFASALILMAQLLGVAESQQEGREARRRAWIEQQRRRELEEREEQQRIARKIAGKAWDSLSVRSVQGERYVNDRGVMHQGDLQRYGERSVCVPVHCLRTGDLVNVVGRDINPGSGPKVRCLPGLIKQGAIGKMHWRPVMTIVVEGVIDYLTACMLWPVANVLGADGCSEIPKIVMQISHRIAQAGTGLTIVPHRDGAGGAGQLAAVKAVSHAVGNGLILGRTLRILQLPANDLNDAYNAGWRT